MEITLTACTEKKKTDKFTVYEATDSEGKKYDAFEQLETGKPIQVDVIPNGNYNPRLKPIKPKNGFGGGKQRAGNESFALSYAKDIQVAHIMMGKEFKTENMLTVADKLFEWLEKHKS